MVRITKSIFFKPRDKTLARKISIKDPSAFRRSIKNLSKGGITPKEKKALILARTRASLQLKRKNLSPKEVKQFTRISEMKIPPISKRIKLRKLRK